MAAPAPDAVQPKPPMLSFDLHELTQTLPGKLHGQGQGLRFAHVATDSRRIAFAESTLFFALEGPQRHGMQYLEDAWAQGVRQFVVPSLPEQPQWLQQGLFWVVPQVLQALQLLAAQRRQQLSLPVLAITGSNGKTVVKEWLYEALEPETRVVRSPKSYNSQIGVPLSVWYLTNDADLGIIEAGISQPGEMERLQQVIQPTMGLFTMLGDAHQEGFASDAQKLEEKFKLFAHCQKLFCHTDDERIARAAAAFGGQLRHWGHAPDCWLRITHQQVTDGGTQVQLACGQQRFDVVLPFTGQADVENAMHVVAFLVDAGYHEAHIQQRLHRLRPVDMRLQWKRAIHQCHLLNDSYSNDMTSLHMALHYLQQQGRHTRRTAILSDLMGITPDQEAAAYSQLPDLLQRYQVGRLLAVGPAWQRQLPIFAHSGIAVQHFAHTAALLQAWPQLAFGHEDILLKGGRSFAFEQIAALLEAQLHETVLEINLTKLAANLRYYRSLLQPGTRMMVMVKAFGYGSGDAEVARLLQHSGVHYLAVAYADEGVALRQSGVSLPIMVLNCPPQSFAQLEQYQLEPELYSVPHLQQFVQWAQAQGLQHFPVHLKIDTGMHRLGLEPGADIAEAVQHLQAQGAVQVKSVFTHLVASEDDTADAFTRQQLTRFDEVCRQLQQGLGYSFLQHAANTAAISRHPQAHYHMVRLGIGLYGGTQGLQPIMTLKTTVAQVKQVKAGETVGYGRHFVLPHDARIATVRIGYADGYRRQLSNGKGAMWLRGQRAPVAGHVCMDMTMLDVTHIPGVQPGDEVEVFGPHLPMAEVAKACGTIVYELMTGLSQRIKRVYVEE